MSYLLAFLSHNGYYYNMKFFLFPGSLAKKCISQVYIPFPFPLLSLVISIPIAIFSRLPSVPRVIMQQLMMGGLLKPSKHSSCYMYITMFVQGKLNECEQEQIRHTFNEMVIRQLLNLPVELLVCFYHYNYILTSLSIYGLKYECIYTRTDSLPSALKLHQSLHFCNPYL